MIGVLLAFKVVTIGLILVVSNAAEMAILPLIAMNWLWLIVLGVFLSAIPFAYWCRLLRARSRRKQLKRSEWIVR